MLLSLCSGSINLQNCREYVDVGLDKKRIECKIVTYVLGAQKNRLIEMVLLSTHSI